MKETHGGAIDAKQIENRVLLGQRLWECNVDANSGQMTVEQLCVELRAGGVNEELEKEVRFYSIKICQIQDG